MWESGHSTGAWRPPRSWNNVEVVGLVRSGDVFHFLAVDGDWREGTVRKRAIDIGNENAWWVTIYNWSDDEFELAVTIVERQWNGTLHELSESDVDKNARERARKELGI